MTARDPVAGGWINPRPPCHAAHDRGDPMSQPIHFEIVFTASAEVTPAVKPAVKPEQSSSTTPEKEHTP